MCLILGFVHIMIVLAVYCGEYVFDTHNAYAMRCPEIRKKGWSTLSNTSSRAILGLGTLKKIIYLSQNERSLAFKNETYNTLGFFSLRLFYLFELSHLFS
jgi:hypothetical protein